MDVQTDNVFFGEALRNAHTSAVRKSGERPRLIRLPEPDQIQFHRSGPDIHIHMTAEAVCGNMQTNGAAFEGWSLALRLWLWPIAQSVILHWTLPPRDEKTGGLNPHYARFLYRVQRFSEQFAKWFRIGTEHHLIDCEVRKGTSLFLNVPGAISKEPVEAKPETELERALVGKHVRAFCDQFHLLKADRQFPVGLYRNANLSSRVFTAGTSAIDIVGVGDSAISVFELKARMNIDIGGLGELLFYAAVMRDAVGPSARFAFGVGKNAKSRSLIGPADVQKAQAVRAIFIAENFHPLFEHPLLALTVNEAFSQQDHAVPLTFEAVKISDVGAQTPSFRRFAS